MLTNAVSIIGLSFIVGVRHATDSDHIVAISTIIARQKKGISTAALVGAFWSLGHALTVTLVGLPIIIYSLSVPKQTGIILEITVGLMLIILGILNFKNPFKLHRHSHTHEWDIKHSHVHIHLIRPISIGLIHGLAGSAAIALLVLSSINDRRLAAFYLFIFHSGVLLGMLIVTILIGIFIKAIKNRSDIANRYLVSASGLLSIIFGLYMIFQILFP